MSRVVTSGGGTQVHTSAHFVLACTALGVKVTPTVWRNSECRSVQCRRDRGPEDTLRWGGDSGEATGCQWPPLAWGPLLGSGALCPQPWAPDCAGREAHQEPRTGGWGGLGRRGLGDLGRGACSSKAGGRTGLQSRALCCRTRDLVGAQSLMTA